LFVVAILKPAQHSFGRATLSSFSFPTSLSIVKERMTDGDEDLMNRIDELPNDKIMSAKSCVLVLLEMACSSFNES
jgi:hypothetical protein